MSLGVDLYRVDENEEEASVWAFSAAGRTWTEFPVISHSSGIYFWDTDGKRYLDGTSGAIVVNIGYGNEHVRQAMIEQSKKTCYGLRRFFANEPSMKLVKMLTKLAGPGFDQAFLLSSGSASIEAALKLARHYAVSIGQGSRWKVIGRVPGFHGSTLGSASVMGDPDHDAIYGPMSLVMPKVPAPLTYRVPSGYNADSYAAFCAGKLEEAILEEGPESVLGFIMEPIGGQWTGALVAPDHYYRSVREICDRYGVLIIYDEVLTGCGRTGPFLAAHHWPDVIADIVVLAKGIGSGYTPIGAVLAPNRIADALSKAGGWFHSQTMAGNPLSSAIGVAVLEELLRLDLMTRSLQMGVLLRERLIELMQRSSIIGDVRGKGLLCAVEIVSNKETKETLPDEMRAAMRIAEIGRELGLLLFARRAKKGVFGEWLLVAPPLIITERQIDELVGLLAETVFSYEKEIGRM